jgi:DNA-binding MarR family transcriptional regulator
VPKVKPRLDELIHAPTRLSIVAILASTQWAEFRFVRDEVGVSDSVLSKQVSQLEAAGYVKVKKGYVGKRPRTWLQITRAGQKAFDGHLAALQQIVEKAGARPTSSPDEALPRIGSSAEV